ncbi:MAG: hypothetical protein CLLPBCKN_007326 [Chroococcidiopsis cubana SAG 39.79]|uniref:Uncharacterized protein n=1 Tax=Chroococcidiopsis cubana SAG 39.79 TaxID=388085 RepID=A0AB37USC6_9CYAN|nr:hypothetical protein [Chroococcidiopsis cubana]MDZ4877891.1 hypothetical protein [Chroococcidiopsis cubana SAG 39.79]PSB58510.1 hypothetical protein C7B79_29795 [Chroococcidiopsis cubana CCALA 043]RUT14159.1 hypothetical protein DSM107010_06420 [Chroococcidiopsis cubana SAG 39.79]
MKFFLLSSLSVLLISAATAPTVKAEIAAVTNTANNAATISQLKPFNLVHMAYQGYFRDQGIPGYGAFLSAYRMGRITPKKLVQSAVERNKLSVQALNNKRYLRAVEAQLFSLSKR